MSFLNVCKYKWVKPICSKNASEQNKMSYKSKNKSHGNVIYVRYIDENNIRSEKVVTPNEFQMTLFEPTIHESKFKDIYGKNMKPVKFDSYMNAKAVGENKSKINKEHHGQNDILTQYISDEFKGQKLIQTLKDVNLAIIDIEVDTQNIMGFPIPEKAEAPINAITLYDNTKNIYYVFGLVIQDNQNYTTNRSDVVYKEFDNESEMLKSFLDCWEDIDIDIISGWNSVKFDIPYIYNRIIKILDNNEPLWTDFMTTKKGLRYPLEGGCYFKYASRLSPWKGVDRIIKKNTYGKKDNILEILGINHFDYMEVYKGFTFKTQEKYSLNHIAHIELGTGKIDYTEHKNLFTLYRNDYQKFIDYNITDVELIKNLENKLGLIDVVLSLVMISKCDHNRIFGTILRLDAWIYNECLNNNIIVPFNEKAKYINVEKESSVSYDNMLFETEQETNYELEKLIGGFVAEPIVGLHKYIASFDMNSLYPSTIRLLNISPETKLDKPIKKIKNNWYRDKDNYSVCNNVTIEKLLDNGFDKYKTYLKDNNLTLAANGVNFKRDSQGILPYLTELLYQERKDFKNKYIESCKNIEDIKRELEKRKNV
jgi:DNA polymerase elongation subunit (family B)